MERVTEQRTRDRFGSAREQSAGQASSPRPVRAQLKANERWIAAAIFTATVAYLWIFRRYTSMEPDEGIVLEGAQRILRGEVLYRDFFSYFTPGSYYFLAEFIRLSPICWQAVPVRARARSLPPPW